jgi:malate dehydrogenase (oxaloacetate-decarboxylating)(NADP+)
MIYATSLSVVDSLTASEKAAGVIFPDIERIRDVSAIVAVATIRAAVSEGNCDLTDRRSLWNVDIDDDEALMHYVKKKMYDPVYVPLVDEVYKD